MEFKIEPALPDDIDEIMRIEDESFAPEIREARSVFQDRLETFPEGNFVLVRDTAAHTGQAPRTLAGYFASEIWNDVPPPVIAGWQLGHSARERHHPAGTVLYVSSFAVEPVSRGCGTELFKLSIARVAARHPAIRTITFIVHEDWGGARHIYEKAGFAYAGRIEGFFPKTGEAGAEASAAALIMKKDL